MRGGGEGGGRRGGVGWGGKAFVLPHADKSRVMALGVLTTRSPQEQTHPQEPAPLMLRLYIYIYISFFFVI
jgi:hypothetical protein